VWILSGLLMEMKAQLKAAFSKKYMGYSYY